MDKKLIEKMKLGNNDGLNSTLDIIKETYKNFQLVAPISPHKKRKGILDPKNMKQKINLTLLNQQIEQITILFIQKAFSVIFMDHHQREQIEKLQENIQKRQELEEFKLKQEQSRQKRNSINIQKIIRPSQLMTKKVHKSIFNQNGDSSPAKSICSSNFSQEDELDLSINIESDSETNSQQQQTPQMQQKPSQMKRFANVVGRFIDTKRRYSWKQDLISKLGINKQVEDKFERFMSKNFTKLQRQDTVQVNEKKVEKTQNDNDNDNDLTPLTRSRNISLDTLIVGRQNLRNHYEDFLSKENVDISNYEDGWKSRNEKLFLKKSLQNLNLFQKHKDAVFKNSQTNEKLFESLNYKYYKRNEVIFHVGDDGDTYYIVLRGSVVLLLPKSNEDAELLEKEAEIRQKLFLSYLGQNKKQMNVIQESKQKELEKKIFVRDHIVKARESSLPLVFNLSQSSTLTQAPSNQAQKEFNQEIQYQQSKYSDQEVAKISSSRKILFPQSSEDNQEDVNQLFPKSNGSINQQRKSKTGDDKVSFFELARFLKVQESDFNYYVTKQFPLMKQIRIFGPGEAFGEIALLTKSRRTGTMVCKEDSHVMTLKKDGFDKIMGYYNNVIINERIEFFKQFEFMKNIPESKLMVLLHETKIEYFTRSQIIYKEKDHINNVYLIKEGNIEISEKIYINQQKYSTQNSQDIQENSQQSEIDNQNIIEKFFIKTYQQQNKQKRLVVYSQSNLSFFGELELLDQNATERTQQAMCTSIDCTVYSVKKEIFFQMLRRFGGMSQLELESQEKRNLQLQIIQSFQNKKTEKILKKNQIKYERQKRKQQIQEQLNLRNKKSDQIETLDKSPKQSSNIQQNSSYNSSTSSMYLKNNQKQKQSLKSSESIIAPKNMSKINQLRKEMIEIQKSYVGQKSIDEAIKRTFFTPGIDWVNPCYRSLDDSKYSNKQLDQKLKNLNNNQNKMQYERSEYCILYDEIKRSSSFKNSSPKINNSQNCYNQNQSQNSPTVNKFFQDCSRRSSSNFNNSPVSNKSQTFYKESAFNSKNISLVSFQDYVLNPQKSNLKNNTDCSSNLNNFKEQFSNPSLKEQRLSSSYYYNINLRKVNRKSQSTNINCLGDIVTNQQNTNKQTNELMQNNQERKTSTQSISKNGIYQQKLGSFLFTESNSNGFSNIKSQKASLTNNSLIVTNQQNTNKQTNELMQNNQERKTSTQSISKNGIYQQKLGSFLFTESNSNGFSNIKSQKASLTNNSSKLSSQNFISNKNIINLTTTIRKESFTQNSFLQKQLDAVSSTFYPKFDLENNSVNLVQENMFKTQKQLKQELQTQSQIKNAILGQFMKESQQVQTQSQKLFTNLLYEDNPLKQKALEKAMLSKLIPFRKKPIEQKPKQFNKIHINIIEKLNLNS
ncbi:hypothetical protein ABPG72_012930 [Tetrahymena utriculariae]